MRPSPVKKRERGVALVVALLFLLVVTVISVVAASNSSLSLKMSSNMQDAYSSFQSAEAGILATLLLVGTAVDPFDGDDSLTPFSTFNAEEHPLRELNDAPGSVNVDVLMTSRGLSCPRSVAPSSDGLFDCDYYRIESEHTVTGRARTKVNQGMVKTVIGTTVR